MADRKTRTDEPSARSIAERPVVYHGIRIPPVQGKRSPVAEALRQALLEQRAVANRETIGS